MAIIGAGLSGLAAGIRLAHFGRRVCIFERHNAPGGLNSFYSIGGRKFDVGLHAVTNFVRQGARGTPLARVLRQLRIEREEFDLCEQEGSRIAFGPAGERALRFTNDPAVLEAEVGREFPRERDGFARLVATVRRADFGGSEPARGVLARHLADPLLAEMLVCPVLYYGGAREHDIEFGRFAMLFQAIFLEGLARPFEGIRAIVRVLLDRYRRAGGERRMKCGVKRIVEKGGAVAALVLDSGEEVRAKQVLSTIGAEETLSLISPETASSVEAAARRFSTADEAAGRRFHGEETGRRLSFVETISVLDRQPAEFGWKDTIVFFNDSERFTYAAPAERVDPRSGVICLPNNFDFGPERRLPEGILRATCLASYEGWKGLAEEPYRAEKAGWFSRIQASARRFLPPVSDSELLAATRTTDMFTPRTLEKYTGHFGGAIYGSPTKHPSGRTSLSNLFLCGTDQGLSGIVGSMLSGVLMANEHVLLKTA